MSVLPGGRSLEQALPDLEELLEDPVTYLGEGPLVFGPRRMYHLAGLFALPGVALLVSAGMQDRFDGEKVAMGVGLLIGSCVWIGWSLLLRGHELVFHADGLEVVHGETSIWAPWELFHVEGRPFLPESDSPQAGLTLPVNPDAIPFIELRRDGNAVAWGRAAQATQWRLTDHDEVVLPGRYEIQPLDIGELLLVLGNRLGKRPEKLQVPPPGATAGSATGVQVVQTGFRKPEWVDLVARPAGPAADPNGWFTVPLTRLKLPPCCARCGGPRDDVLRIGVMARGDWLLGLFLGGARGIEVPVPVCNECRDTIGEKQNRGTALGLGLGATLGAATGLLAATLLGQERQTWLLLAGIAGLVVGGLVGSVVGMWWTRRLPVRVKNYSPSRGLVSVKCENPEIAARVIEAARSRPVR